MEQVKKDTTNYKEDDIGIVFTSGQDGGEEEKVLSTPILLDCVVVVGTPTYLGCTGGIGTPNVK